jgi:hypothetical protein
MKKSFVKIYTIDANQQATFINCYEYTYDLEKPEYGTCQGIVFAKDKKEAKSFVEAEMKNTMAGKIIFDTLTLNKININKTKVLDYT